MFENENDWCIRREKERETETYLIGKRNERLSKEDRWVVVPLLLRRMSSLTEAQWAEDYENEGSMNKNKETNSERQKSKKKGKILPFISPRRIKSRPLDQVQYTSIAGGSETRSTVGIKSLFRNLN